MPSVNAPGADCARVASPFRGVDLDGDKLDNLDEWYAVRALHDGI
jgi:hypothetical protein